MFWLSRWKYSGEPGAGPAAQAPPVATNAMNVPVTANAIVAPIRLPIVCLPQTRVRRCTPAPNAGKAPRAFQDRTPPCLDRLAGREGGVQAVSSRSGAGALS